jgi:SET domain-containing protein
MKDKFKKVIVELRPSKITPKGIGVFAIASIKKGNRIFEGICLEDFNDLFPWTNFHILPKSTQQKILAFCVGTPQGSVPPENLDFNNLSIEWYLNHSCEGNVGFDSMGDFIAIKNIKSGNELAYDYGLVESNPDFHMKCMCKSLKCRGIITGLDWKKLKNDPKKFRFMHPYLKNKQTNN